MRLVKEVFPAVLLEESLTVNIRCSDLLGIAIRPNLREYILEVLVTKF
jgi:hypothetical protein